MEPNLFERCMKLVLAPNGANNISDGEKFADKQLLIATNFSMQKKLEKGSNRGLFGWWNEKLCDISSLYEARDKAIAEKDHVSVINYTAMIAMREATN